MGQCERSADPRAQAILISSKVDYSPWATSITDSEPDGMWDEWEMGQFGNPATANATSDTDMDGLLDKDEFLYGTNPNNKDSDGDGVWDGREVQAGMNPTLAGDYDFDGDDDGYSNLREIIAGTDPWDDASIPPILADGTHALGDGDVDGKDLAGLIAELGSINCPGVQVRPGQRRRRGPCGPVPVQRGFRADDAVRKCQGAALGPIRCSSSCR